VAHQSALNNVKSPSGSLLGGPGGLTYGSSETFTDAFSSLAIEVELSLLFTIGATLGTVGIFFYDGVSASFGLIGGAGANGGSFVSLL
jgi:hypothetical protein